MATYFAPAKINKHSRISGGKDEHRAVWWHGLGPISSSIIVFFFLFFFLLLGQRLRIGILIHWQALEVQKECSQFLSIIFSYAYLLRI